MKGARTWIVAVDARKARFFEKLAAGARLTEMENLAMVAPPLKPPRDRAPRVHDRLGNARHRVEARIAPRLASEHAFLKSVIQRLEEQADAKAFDALIISSPPKTAGFIKVNLPEGLSKLVSEVWLKDLTRSPLADIEVRLEGDRGG